jgi:hypothetical protein
MFSLVQATLLFDVIVRILCNCDINNELCAVVSVATVLLAVNFPAYSPWSIVNNVCKLSPVIIFTD